MVKQDPKRKTQSFQNQQLRKKVKSRKFFKATWINHKIFSLNY